MNQSRFTLAPGGRRPQPPGKVAESALYTLKSTLVCFFGGSAAQFALYTLEETALYTLEIA